MPAVIDNYLERQLLSRRDKLERAAAGSRAPAHLQYLLAEVDRALEKMDDGSYGLCEACHDSIECDRLLCDPLVRFCLDHLSSRERTALEQDLELAARVQKALLPRESIDVNGWHICYHYDPAGVVSGDYCDVIDAADAGLYFMVGDVSGKGVAASMLMAHLHAMFRTLISVGFSLKSMLERASRVFSESTLPNQYATLVCGRALPDGRIEISNAGHPSPLLIRCGEVTELEGSGLPVGMFRTEDFLVSEFDLGSGHGLVIYSDGVSEATDTSGAEYGIERIRKLIDRERTFDPLRLLSNWRDDLTAFRCDAMKTDDCTMFVLGRTAST
ncbi:MAG: SpoIIE family protein phosphatase [Acidobacteriaceae bacterium]|nr:SpoIIE family protein phosphatase [Acidobacteriaceae bacterium]